MRVSDCHGLVLGPRGFEHWGLLYLLDFSDEIGLAFKLPLPGTQHLSKAWTIGVGDHHQSIQKQVSNSEYPDR